MIPDRFFDRRALAGPSPGDRLLANTQTIRLDLLRFIDDDDRPAVSCTFRLSGCLEVAANVSTGELLIGLVQALEADRREGGAT